MPTLPWFPFYHQDFQLSKKVKNMTNEQKGAYLTLLIENWSEPTFSLPARAADLRLLANWKGSQEDFKIIRACFTAHPDRPGKLHNERLYREWKKAEGKRIAASTSAKSRWHKPELNVPPTEQPRTPIPKRAPTGFQTINTEIAAITDKWLPPV